MDFPTVFREIAPLESIIQSGGRCNREGKMQEPGVVHLFALTDTKSPSPLYAVLGQFANLQYKGHEEQLLTFDFFTKYYQDIIKLFCATDKFKINKLRQNWEFAAVASSYKLINKNTVALFIYQYNEESRILYNAVKGKEFLSRDNRRAMNQFCVQVYEKFMQENKRFIGEEVAGFYVTMTT
ncbi:MAG: hypothetical protein RSC07_02390 [Mucinivorans sp.]